jgi:hypothetical protein
MSLLLKEFVDAGLTTARTCGRGLRQTTGGAEH